MLHAYCIRRLGEPPPSLELRGVGGSPVWVLEMGALGIWLSESDDGNASLERLREHERVVRVALRSSTPLPLRFGARFENEAAAIAMLRERGEEFLAELDRLANRVEMGLRIEYAQLEGPGPADPRQAPAVADLQGNHPGRAYLEERRAALRSAEEARETSAAVLDEIESHLVDLGLPSARSIENTPPQIGSVAHLVHRNQLRLYRNRIEQLQLDRGDLRITVTGPWAPYSFV